MERGIIPPKEGNPEKKMKQELFTFQEGGGKGGGPAVPDDRKKKDSFRFSKGGARF